MQSVFFEYFKNNKFSSTSAKLIITANDKESKIASDICTFYKIKTFILPDLRASFGEDLRSYKNELLGILSELGEFWRYSGDKILILPVKTAALKLPTQNLFDKKTIEFGQKIDLNGLKDQLFYWGYEFCDVVEEEGEVSFRGDIIDIFTPQSKNPLRISLLDDEIESIREFEPSTQKSQKEEIESFFLVPVFFAFDKNQYEKCIQNIEFIKSDAFVKDIASLGFWAVDGEYYFNLFKSVQSPSVKSEIFEYDYSKEDGFEALKSIFEKIPTILEPKNYKDLVWIDPKELVEYHINKKNITIIYKNETQLRSYNLLGLKDVKYLESNIVLNVISENEIILSLNKEEKKQTRSKKKGVLLDELKIGDYVVHENYGVGLFNGLEISQVLGATKEFVVISYQGEERLLLPVENISYIDRYIAEGGYVPVLDRLGKGSFQKLKSKAKEKLFAIAQEIVETAAKRELQRGFKVKIDERKIAHFQSQSGFEYTPDQQRSIEEIFEDLQSGRVMDRLLSGDVGFGKTEVAMNAIFATVSSGFQAAFVAPTTLLSNQHYKSLSKRFNNYGFKIAKLDRFCSAKEKATIIKSLLNQEIDIVVGTHAILESEFKNLALLVIDEEHKFGVKQKEKLKNLHENIHILSMSATPIPRSLNMALSSIKGYSEILTPPKEREDVRTLVKEYDEKVVKEAILREIRRGGQIFYVHNRIATIDQRGVELKRMLPSLRLAVLHSKITSVQIENEMIDFEDGKFDLLLSTSIVESGLHLPNANTIIIESSDRFGIADLHQLRGRVGRGKKQGYCYFLVEDKENLTQEAKKRLLALESNSHLGSGSRLAYHDLEIRGGGNLVGESQSGHIKEVGYSLYLRMLEDAINELLGKKQIKNSDVEMRLSVNAYLNPNLITQDRLRLELYRRLSLCEEPMEVYEIEGEIEDRFGKIDPVSRQFLDLIVIKILAGSKNIKSISNYNQNITIEFENNKKDYLIAPSKDDDDIISQILKFLRK